MTAERLWLVRPVRPLSEPVACRPWCVYQDGHRQEDPVDQMCFGPELRTDVDTLRDRDDGPYWEVYSQYEHHDGSPVIHMGKGEAYGVYLTPDEARAIAVTLIACADQLGPSGGGATMPTAGSVPELSVEADPTA